MRFPTLPFQKLITVITQLLIAADLASAENIWENARLHFICILRDSEGELDFS